MIETAQHLRRHRISRRRTVDATTAGSCGAEFASTSLFPFWGKRLTQRRSRRVTDAAPTSQICRRTVGATALPAPPHGPDPMLKTSRPQRSSAALDHHVYAGLCPPHINDLVPTVMALAWAKLNRGTGEAPQATPARPALRAGRHAVVIDRVEPYPGGGRKKPTAHNPLSDHG